MFRSSGRQCALRLSATARVVCVHRAGAGVRRFSSTWQNASVEDRVVWSLIGVNAAVFAVSTYGDAALRDFGDVRVAKFLDENFRCSWANLRAGRVWTLVTASFSHQDVMHFGINMFVLHSFAPVVIYMLGRRRFLRFYAGSALAASVAHLFYTREVLPRLSSSRAWFRRYDIPSHGASGVVMATMVFFSIVNPAAKLMLFMVVPVPAALLVAGVVGWDLFHATKSLEEQRGSSGLLTDRAGHLGGAAFGALFYFGVRNRLWRR